MAGMTAQPAWHNAYRWLDVGNFERELFKATRVVPHYQLAQLDQMLQKPKESSKPGGSPRRRTSTLKPKAERLREGLVYDNATFDPWQREQAQI